MKKRLIAIFLISALLLTALVSCKSKEEKNPFLSDELYDETDVVTNLVKMNITYTNSKGPDRYGESLEKFLRGRKYFGAVLIGIRKQGGTL